MEKIVLLFTLSAVMIAVYKKTFHPKLSAFINIMLGEASLIAAELLTNGSLEGISTYNAAISAVLGVPGTVLTMVMRSM